MIKLERQYPIKTTCNRQTNVPAVSELMGRDGPPLFAAWTRLQGAYEA